MQFNLAVLYLGPVDIFGYWLVQTHLYFSRLTEGTLYCSLLLRLSDYNLQSDKNVHVCLFAKKIFDVDVIGVYNFVNFSQLHFFLYDCYLLQVLHTLFLALVVRKQLQDLSVKCKSARFLWGVGIQFRSNQQGLFLGEDLFFKLYNRIEVFLRQILVEFISLGLFLGLQLFRVWQDFFCFVFLLEVELLDWSIALKTVFAEIVLILISAAAE